MRAFLEKSGPRSAATLAGAGNLQTVYLFYIPALALPSIAERALKPLIAEVAI